MVVYLGYSFPGVTLINFLRQFFNGLLLLLTEEPKPFFLFFIPPPPPFQKAYEHKKEVLFPYLLCVRACMLSDPRKLPIFMYTSKKKAQYNTLRGTRKELSNSQQRAPFTPPDKKNE